MSVLDPYWFNRPDVGKFVNVLERLGYEWEIIDLAGSKPVLRIWKPKEGKKVEEKR